MLLKNTLNYMNKKIIWIGPIVKSKDISRFKAISPAANKWQLSFIEALQNLDINVINISYLPEPIFPKGDLLPTYCNKDKSLKTESAKYLNVLKLRELTLSLSLIKKIKKNDNVEFIITYNNSISHIEAGRFAQNKLNKKWVNIVADDKYAEGPDLTIFLSYDYYVKANLKNKIHIDGGIDNLEFDETFDYLKNPKILLFSGALNKWTGIEKFASDFSTLNFTEIELHIYGKGNSELLKKLANAYTNIKLKGFVDEEELQIAMKNCFAFINPRPTDIEGGENNFPSKLLLYLMYGKPIISTKTAGIAPYYDDFLFYYIPEKKQSVISAIVSVTNMENNDLVNFQNRLKTFVRNRSWQNIGEQFLKSISQI